MYTCEMSSLQKVMQYKAFIDRNLERIGWQNWAEIPLALCFVVVFRSDNIQDLHLSI